MAEKNFGKAREMFARAIGKIPDEPHFWEALGESQLALGETEAAAASFRTAEELGRAAAGR